MCVLSCWLEVVMSEFYMSWFMCVWLSVWFMFRKNVVVIWKCFLVSMCLWLVMFMLCVVVLNLNVLMC